MIIVDIILIQLPGPEETKPTRGVVCDGNHEPGLAQLLLLDVKLSPLRQRRQETPRATTPAESAARRRISACHVRPASRVS